MYSVGTLPADAQLIYDLGGITRRYLNHWHEAQFGCDRIASTFETSLVCRENERQSVSKTCDVAETFERQTLNDDFEVIPTPGHTSGATAFTGDSGRHRCLFTGDTIYLSNGE